MVNNSTYISKTNYHLESLDTKKKKTTGQAQKCGRAKPVNEIPNPYFNHITKPFSYLYISINTTYLITLSYLISYFTYTSANFNDCSFILHVIISFSNICVINLIISFSCMFINIFWIATGLATYCTYIW